LAFFEREKRGNLFTGIVLQYVRQLIDQANRAAVVFYPIDPLGLQPGGLQASDSIGQRDIRSIPAAVEARRKRVFDSEGGINFIARETGGFATFNTNDLNKGMERALNDQSYYLVGYDPEAETFNAATSKYNKLEVKVLRKGALARYRSGFFAVTDARNITAPPPDKSVGYVQQLRDAILSPFAVNGITLKLSSLFGSSGESDLYVRSLLHIDANELSFKDEADGQKTCAFEVLATSYGPGGEVGDQIGKTYTVTIRPEIFKRVVTDGIVYHFKFPAKKAGGFQYRVAIRDSYSGRIGAASQFVQVPDVKGGSLTSSSIVLEDMSADEFQRSLSGGSRVFTDPMRDTALRQIQVGRVYRYSYEIYNAHLDDQRHPSLETRIRVFREGKLILDGQPKPFDASGQTDMAHL